jgi:hypothetical protein
LNKQLEKGVGEIQAINEQNIRELNRTKNDATISRVFGTMANLSRSREALDSFG